MRSNVTTALIGENHQPSGARMGALHNPGSNRPSAGNDMKYSDSFDVVFRERQKKPHDRAALASIVEEDTGGSSGVETVSVGDAKPDTVGNEPCAATWHSGSKPSLNSDEEVPKDASTEVMSQFKIETDDMGEYSAQSSDRGQVDQSAQHFSMFKTETSNLEVAVSDTLKGSISYPTSGGVLSKPDGLATFSPGVPGHASFPSHVAAGTTPNESTTTNRVQADLNFSGPRSHSGPTGRMVPEHGRTEAGFLVRSQTHSDLLTMENSAVTQDKPDRSEQKTSSKFLVLGQTERAIHVDSNKVTAGAHNPVTQAELERSSNDHRSNLYHTALRLEDINMSPRREQNSLLPPTQQSSSGFGPLTAANVFSEPKMSTSVGGEQSRGLLDEAQSSVSDRLSHVAPIAEGARSSEHFSNLRPSTAHDARQTETARQIAVQIAQNMSHNEKRVVEIQLSPEELGTVRYRMTATDGHWTIVVQADRPETQDLLRRNLEHLELEFSSLGLGDTSISFGNSEETMNDEFIGESAGSETEDANLENPENAEIMITTPLGVDLRV